MREYEHSLESFPSQGTWKFLSPDSDSPPTGSVGGQEDKLFSHETSNLFKTIAQLDRRKSPTSLNDFQGRGGVDEMLFDARAAAKVAFSQVSMHFSADFRERLFDQVDRLHDADDWEDGDFPVERLSFNTFLRWFYLNKPERLPSFGLSSAGHFIATWLCNENKDRLTLEFLPSDRIKWFVTKDYGGELDHGAGITVLTRILTSLAPYDPDSWMLRSE